MRFILWLNLLFLSGCASIPKGYENNHVLNTPSLSNSISEGLDANIIAINQEAKCPWWRSFDDPQLEHLIKEALSHNPQLDIALARVKQTTEEAAVDRSRLFPSIFYNTDVTGHYYGEDDFFRAFATTIPANITEYEMNFSIAYDFDFWGKWQNTYRAALSDTYSMLAEQAQTELIVSTAVAASYYLLQTHMHELELAKRQSQYIQENFNIRKLRQENALDDKEQTLAAEEALYISKKQVHFIHELVKLQENQLRQLLGKGPDDHLPIKKIDSFPNAPVSLPKCLDANLMGKRPDLAASIWRAKREASLVHAAVADFYPNINLVALAGFDSVFANNFFKWKNRTSEVGPALRLPIFTAGAIRANYRAQRARYDQAVAEYNVTLLHAVKEISNQIIQLKTADQNLKLQNEVVEASLKRKTLTEARYNNALSDQANLIVAEIQLNSSQLVQLQSQYKKILAAIELIKAIGGDYNNG